ncbi:MAG TPA: sigma-70 family RNA polymerase sigma factor [Planctomycetota bacterium]|nr:sigma-70 family RNA polymerase sigma factor [Planctomycetota bacterium]
MSDRPAGDETVVLLARYHGGDEAAFEQLLANHLPFLRHQVERLLGQRLRQRDEPEDLVQSAARELLLYGPRFQPQDGAQFRALLAQIVHRVILHRDRWYQQKRRDMHREVSQAGKSVVLLGQAASQSSPDHRAARDEDGAWIRLALEFLEPDDREMLVRRTFDEQSFAEIGEALGVTEEAATKRYQRALPKLAAKLRELRGGGAAG